MSHKYRPKLAVQNMQNLHRQKNVSRLTLSSLDFAYSGHDLFGANFGGGDRVKVCSIRQMNIALLLAVGLSIVQTVRIIITRKCKRIWRDTLVQRQVLPALLHASQTNVHASVCLLTQRTWHTQLMRVRHQRSRFPRSPPHRRKPTKRVSLTFMTPDCRIPSSPTSSRSLRLDFS
jgi:ribosomal protein L44E